MNTTLIPPGTSVPQHAYSRLPTSAPEDPYAQQLKQSEPVQAYSGNPTQHNHQHQRPGHVRSTFDQFLDEANENPIDAIANTKVGGFFVGIVKYFMRFFGLVLVAVALFLIISIVFLFFFVVIPMLSPIPFYSQGPTSLTYLLVFGINFSVGIWVAFNLLFNYIQTMRTSPGYVPVEWMEQHQHAHEKAEEVGGHAPGTARWSKHCNKCKKPKPPRTHHCHICDTCVLRMDHHCPWVNNCVGYKNHRYFVLFLFYLWFACSYLTLILLGCSFDFIPLHDIRLWYDWQAIITFVMVLCASMAITMTGFFGWHAYLVLTNQTTIEFQFNKIKAWTVSNKGEVSTNEYDMGPKQNLQQIFGYGGFFSWIAPTLNPPPLNGTDWPTLSSLKV